MKNKLCYIVLGILTCFSFLSSVYADEVEITASADKNTVIKGQEVSVVVKVKSEKPVFACTMDISDNADLAYVKNERPSGATNGHNISVGNSNDGVRRVVVELDANGVDVTNEYEMVILKYKVNNSGNISVLPVSCNVIENENSQTSNITTGAINIQITAEESSGSGGGSSSSDNTLSNIEVTGGTLSPQFSSDVKTYTVQLNSPSFGLVLTASNSQYQDKIKVKDASGNQYDDWSNIAWSDPTGQKIMRLDICVENECMYELGVSYTVENLNNELKTLKINDENISLETGKYEYKVTVSDNKTGFDLFAELNDVDNFKISEINGDENVEFPKKFNFNDDGKAYVVLVVEPKSSTIPAESLTYTVEVVREGSVSSGNGNSGNSGNNSSGDVNKNPSTGDISMFIMAIILISSLVGSVVLYQKNLESYK